LLNRAGTLRSRSVANAYQLRIVATFCSESVTVESVSALTFALHQ
jgi:hypothetical protein